MKCAGGGEIRKLPAGSRNGQERHVVAVGFCIYIYILGSLYILEDKLRWCEIAVMNVV